MKKLKKHWKKIVVIAILVLQFAYFEIRLNYSFDLQEKNYNALKSEIRQSNTLLADFSKYFNTKDQAQSDTILGTIDYLESLVVTLDNNVKIANQNDANNEAKIAELQRQINLIINYLR